LDYSKRLFLLGHLTQNLDAPLLSTCLSPRQAFDLKVNQLLCKIDAQLRIAGNNLNQMAKACNSAVALGEPVIVNTGLLKSVQQLIRENGGAIKAMVANLSQSTVR
jgi:hypothetical protein